MIYSSKIYEEFWSNLVMFQIFIFQVTPSSKSKTPKQHTEHVHFSDNTENWLTLNVMSDIFLLFCFKFTRQHFWNYKKCFTSVSFYYFTSKVLFIFDSNFKILGS